MFKAKFICHLALNMLINVKKRDFTNMIQNFPKLLPLFNLAVFQFITSDLTAFVSSAR
jgi:hypothetical protein